MNTPLVLGCGLGGAAIGSALGVLAARVPSPAPAAVTADAVAASEGGIAATAPVAAEDVSGAVRRAAAPDAVAAGVVTAGLLALAADHFGAVPALAAYCVLFAGLVAVSVVDLRVGLVPRTFLYPVAALLGVALVAASAVAGDWHALGEAVIGAAIAFAVFFVVWFLYPRGLGFGDVRLAAAIGLGLGWLGLLHLYVGFLVGFLAGVLFGLVVMARRGSGRKTRIPFATALALGAVVGVIWGGQIINAWLPGHG